MISGSTDTRVNDRKKSVLIVDDDTTNAATLAQRLEKEQCYKAIVVESVGDAIQKLNNQKFDCLVVDMFLGQERGTKVIQYARRNKNQNADTPILAMSGSFENSLVLEIRELVNGALVKPFMPVDFVAQINRLCGVKAGGKNELGAA